MGAQGALREAHSPMTYWRCDICGHIHEGEPCYVIDKDGIRVSSWTPIRSYALEQELARLNHGHRWDWRKDPYVKWNGTDTYGQWKAKAMEQVKAIMKQEQHWEEPPRIR